MCRSAKHLIDCFVKVKVGKPSYSWLQLSWCQEALCLPRHHHYLRRTTSASKRKGQQAWRKLSSRCGSLHLQQYLRKIWARVYAELATLTLVAAQQSRRWWISSMASVHPTLCHIHHTLRFVWPSLTLWSVQTFLRPAPPIKVNRPVRVCLIVESSPTSGFTSHCLQLLSTYVSPPTVTACLLGL